MTERSNWDYLLDDMRTDLASAQADLDYDYRFERTFEREIEITIDGSTKSHTVHLDVDETLTVRDYADSTIPDALGSLETNVNSLEGVLDTMQDELDAANTKIAELQTELDAALTASSRTRLPFTKGVRYTASDFADLFDPPDGYEWTGEFRFPTVADLWISSTGTIKENMAYAGKRHMVRKVVPAPLPPLPSGKGNAFYLDPDLPSRHLPPDGYEWTGEFRSALKDEYFLSNTGSVLQRSWLSKRHILRKVATPPVAPSTALQPWPGTGASALGYADPTFVMTYDAPTGFEYKGEFRQIFAGELYIDADGYVCRGPHDGPRHALKGLPGTVMGSESLAVEAADPVGAAPARAPWPGSKSGLHFAEENIPERYDPPTGYEYTGEWRRPDPGELWLGENGMVYCAGSKHPSKRHMLQALPGTTPPARGTHVPVPASATFPTVEALATAPEEPAAPQFEPPRRPEPV